METRKCFYYKAGHLRKDCPILKKQPKGKAPAHANASTNEANTSENYHTTELLSITSACSITDVGISDVWLLDSGCSFHITCHGDWFHDFIHRNCGSVLSGNDESCKVRGIGFVRMRMHDG